VTSTLTAPLHTRTSSPALDFDALYRAARDDVYAYVATLLRDRSAAEDVTASAFERAYRKQRSYKAGRGSERAWLFGIARNAALDELRRRKRTAALTADPADVDAAPPEDDAEAAPPSAPRSRRSSRASASSSPSSSTAGSRTPRSPPCSASASPTPAPSCTAP
jgi:RNA polymerase sigma factor (sigma-70 family)